MGMILDAAFEIVGRADNVTLTQLPRLCASALTFFVQYLKKVKILT